MNHKMLLIYFILFLGSMFILSFISYAIKRLNSKDEKYYAIFLGSFTIFFIQIIVSSYTFSIGNLSKIMYETAFFYGIFSTILFFVGYMYSMHRILKLEMTNLKITALIIISAVVSVFAVFSHKISIEYEVVVLSHSYYLVNLFVLVASIYIAYEIIQYNLRNQNKTLENFFSLSFGLILPFIFFDSLFLRGNTVINLGKDFDIIYTFPFAYTGILIIFSTYFVQNFRGKNYEEVQDKFDLDFLNDKKLTSKELEIAGLISSGYSNQEISEKLGVTENTIKTHAGKIYKKIGVRSRYEMIGMAKNSTKE